MGRLLRAFSWVVRSLLLWVLRTLLPWVLRRMLPWVLRAARFYAMLALIAGAGLWAGVPNAIEMIGRDWEDRAYRIGVPPDYLPYVYHCGQAVATLLILTGWILLAHAIIVVFLIVF